MVALILPICASLQQAAPIEEKHFDFWIGNWSCEGTSYDRNDPKKTQQTKATNKISRTLGNRVVHEQFSMGEFKGESWSVYTPAAKEWRQTWVDNQGSYIALVGGMVGKDMILTTLPNPANPKGFSRMRFTNIKPKSFDWNWEKSDDGGKEWKLMWHLHYKRK